MHGMTQRERSGARPLHESRGGWTILGRFLMWSMRNAAGR